MPSLVLVFCFYLYFFDSVCPLFSCSLSSLWFMFHFLSIFHCRVFIFLLLCTYTLDYKAFTRSANYLIVFSLHVLLFFLFIWHSNFLFLLFLLFLSFFVSFLSLSPLSFTSVSFLPFSFTSFCQSSFPLFFSFDSIGFQFVPGKQIKISMPETKICPKDISFAFFSEKEKISSFSF